MTMDMVLLHQYLDMFQLEEMMNKLLYQQMLAYIGNNNSNSVQDTETLDM